MKTIEGKVVALGSQGVGKTSLIIQYMRKASNQDIKPTVGASFFTCNIKMENTRMKLQVWDTAGQERFRSMAPMYYRKANAAMLVFDLTQYSTFTTIKSWVTELRRNIEEALVLAVIGNKTDLTRQREVDPEEGRTYATKIGASYHETSVLHDEGIDGVFTAIAAGLLSLSTNNPDMAVGLRVYDSVSTGWSSPDLPLTPSIEESSPKISIAHGIHEKPHTCC